MGKKKNFLSGKEKKLSFLEIKEKKIFFRRAKSKERKESFFQLLSGKKDFFLFLKNQGKQEKIFLPEKERYFSGKKEKKTFFHRNFLFYSIFLFSIPLKIAYYSPVHVFLRV